MLLSIDWPVLYRILTLPAPAISALTTKVFLYSITSMNFRVVTDLLQLESIKATVVYNGPALVTAVQASSCDLVNLVLDAGAHPNRIPDRSQNVPLTEARDVQVAQLLVEAGADIDSLQGRYPFSLTYGAGSINGPAIAAATTRKNIDIVRLLIGKGANVNPSLHGDKNLLILALQDGTTEILRALLEAGAQPNDEGDSLSKAGQRMTPLQKAVTMGDFEAVQLLVEHGADVNAPAYGALGTSALQAALQRGDTQISNFLLRRGADVNAPGNADARFPRSLLTTAVEMRRLDLVKFVLDAGADINIASFGYFGSTALESAMSLPNGSEVRDLLVSRGAQCPAQPDIEYFQIQLRRAVLRKDVERIKTLLRTGLKIDLQPSSRSREQRSILQDAIMGGSAIFQLLFDIVRTYDEEVDFHPLLVEAALASNVTVSAALIEMGADLNSKKCRTGKLVGTPLMFAVSKNDLEMVEFLYKKGADIDIIVEGFSLDPSYPDHVSTALQISLWKAPHYRYHNFDVFRFLRSNKATINAPIARKRGLSELALAVTTEDIAIVQELLDDGAIVNSLPADDGGRTALQAACSLEPSNIDMVQLLIQRGADVNAPTADGEITALGEAAKRGYHQVALILLKAGANINAEWDDCGSQETALWMAALYGRLDMVHLLLKAGADLHLPNCMRYVEAASIARKRGHVAIATLLESWKPDQTLLRAIASTESPLGPEITSNWNGDGADMEPVPVLGDRLNVNSNYVLRSGLGFGNTTSDVLQSGPSGDQPDHSSQKYESFDLSHEQDKANDETGYPFSNKPQVPCLPPDDVELVA